MPEIVNENNIFYFIFILKIIHFIRRVIITFTYHNSYAGVLTSYVIFSCHKKSFLSVNCL